MPIILLSCLFPLLRMILYSYFRSSCSWRVRLALNILKIPHQIRPVNLLKNEQRSPAYLAINPLGTVPALELNDGLVLWQSLAIIDYLDSAQILLPTDSIERARCWQITNTICSEIQPLQNLAVGKLITELAGEGKSKEWSVYHNLTKLRIIEHNLIKDNLFCVGNKVTLADICMVPQLYSAKRFGIDIEKEFPKMMKIAKKLEIMDNFVDAHPHSQADCPADIQALGTRFQ